MDFFHKVDKVVSDGYSECNGVTLVRIEEGEGEEEETEGEGGGVEDIFIVLASLCGSETGGTKISILGVGPTSKYNCNIITRTSTSRSDR